jgi:hypothetical protein
MKNDDLLDIFIIKRIILSSTGARDFSIGVMNEVDGMCLV